MTRARSWSALLDELYQGSWDTALGRFRSPYAFRGHTSVDPDLSTSLQRLAAGADIRRLESALLRSFGKYAFEASGRTGAPSIWHTLTLAQHYGLPTRLMDWTYSPLVALHFATGSTVDPRTDGVVWCVDFVKANTGLPARLRRILESEHSQTLTIDMLSRFSSLRAFDALSRAPFVVFVEPPSIDARILNQYALFSLMPGPSAELEPWLSSHEALWRRVVVPGPLKWEVRDKLDQANITERTLFPGLDGLCQWLARYYLPASGARRNRAGART